VREVDGEVDGLGTVEGEGAGLFALGQEDGVKAGELYATLMGLLAGCSGARGSEAGSSLLAGGTPAPELVQAPDGRTTLGG
jgi:hypothetical protein